mmetsp:Transcript_19963/g.42020  ORF Transcript_19963/g.42020 Transcript_19963/m.42020 type:complete len:118 (-) Transcript_19963:62-415(-)
MPMQRINERTGIKTTVPITLCKTCTACQLAKRKCVRDTTACGPCFRCLSRKLECAFIPSYQGKRNDIHFHKRKQLVDPPRTEVKSARVREEISPPHSAPPTKCWNTFEWKSYFSTKQ